MVGFRKHQLSIKLDHILQANAFSLISECENQNYLNSIFKYNGTMLSVFTSVLLQWIFWSVTFFCTTKWFLQNFPGTFMVFKTVFLFLRCDSPISKAERREVLTILKLCAFVAIRPSVYWGCFSVDILLCFYTISNIHCINENAFKYENSVSQWA